MPFYPEKLRRQGVEGEVLLRVGIDEEGLVTGVQVEKSLHPYLDSAAVLALLQWKYEPFLQDGEPTPAVFDVSVGFNREAWRQIDEGRTDRDKVPSVDETNNPFELRRILDGCAAYSRKLAESALDFICVETIQETRCLFSEMKWRVFKTFPVGNPGAETVHSSVPFYTPEQILRNTFVSDYQLLKKGDRIDERRMLLEENGRRSADPKTPWEEKRFTVLSPLFAPSCLLDRDRRPYFDYRLLGEERIDGKKAILIEIRPKFGDADGIDHARAWVDREKFQILKVEIEGIPLEGYEDVLKDIVRLNVAPIFTTTVQYEIEKNGILFPSRTAIRIEYPKSTYAQRPNPPKMKADITYGKYKFFNVETETRFIK
jgi:TonB family protein